MNLNIEKIQEDPVQNSEVEIVERKGLGHPDTICDKIAETVSQTLSKEYSERFGRILHHNTDEVQLVAGKASPKLGGGQLNEKIYILLAGRATKKHKEKEIPVDKIAIKAAKKHIRENFKELKPQHINFKSRIGETSSDLKNNFEQEKTLSNDTSFGVGHHPLSKTEQLALKLEKKIREIEEAGEDIKIMVNRNKNSVNITVATAGISHRIENIQEYREFTEKVKELVLQESRKKFNQAEVNVNSADNIKQEEIYITTTGTSAENGDDGSVGRGNRYNGLITPMRSMSLEANSGKNPVTHVGKINQKRANKITAKINQKTGGFTKAYILNQIGKPVKKPYIHIETTKNTEEIEKIVKEEVRN